MVGQWNRCHFVRACPFHPEHGTAFRVRRYSVYAIIRWVVASHPNAVCPRHQTRLFAGSGPYSWQLARNLRRNGANMPGQDLYRDSAALFNASGITLLILLFFVEGRRVYSFGAHFLCGAARF
jgi:hypothetical protein